MGGVLDTNLLLYAANGDAPEHAKAAARLTARIAEQPFPQGP